MQRLVKTLSELGLTAQEIAEALWLSSQEDEEGIIDVTPSLESEETTTTPSKFNALGQNPPPFQPEGPLPAFQPPQAEIVPTPADKQAALSLPPSYKPIPVPDAPAISQSLMLARALRPLARQIALGLPTIIDETATVDFIAETGLWQPVLKAESEIWLDVALVFDTSPSMCLWQRLGADLYRLLARYGEFRDVRIWRLAHQPGKVLLTTRKGEVRKPRELLIGDRRRLIVVVSDCVAPAWHNGQMRDLMAVWSAKLPTVVFQVFPERLWSRTALARSTIVELKGKQDGLPSDQLQPIARSVWDSDRLRASLEHPGVRLPIVTLEQDSLLNWARVVAGDRRSRVLGIVWDAPPAQQSPTTGSQSAPKPALKEQIDAFVLNASPLARKLAELLVSSPVITLPIVRLIKQSNLSQASAVHIAEVFMSGLLKVSGNDHPTFENAERIVYELVDEAVRDRLRAGSKVGDALQVYQNVSEYVARGLGKSVSQFWALLRLPAAGQVTEETEFLNAFASVTAKILRGLGSEFEVIADTLEQLPPLSEEGSRQTDDFPLQDIEYEVAEYLNFPPLEPFEFIDAQFNSAQDFENDAYRLLEQKTSEIKQLILQDFEEKEIRFQVDMHPRDIQAENIDESRIDVSNEQSTALPTSWWKWYCKIQNDRPLRAEDLDLWLISLAYHLMSWRAQSIDIDFVDNELIENQENYIVFQIRVRINFAVNVGYFDFENHMPSMQESPPHEYRLWPDQSVDGKVEVSFQVFGYNSEEKLIDAEVDSVDLELDTPVLVRSVTEPSSSVRQKMTGIRGPYNPFGRGETPEERVDRLISEILASPNPDNCGELMSALALLSSTDQGRRTRASAALKRCR